MVDPTLSKRLDDARQEARRRTVEADTARSTVRRLETLRAAPAAEILRDQALGGPALAGLRADYTQAATLERALASELLDRHPTLIDARQALRQQEARVRVALGEALARAKTQADTLSRAEETARTALETLERADAARLSQAKELGRLRSIAEEAAGERARLTQAQERRKQVEPLPQPPAPPAPPPPPPPPPSPPPPPPPPPPPLPPPKPEEAAPIEPMRLVQASVPVHPIGPKPIVLVTSSALLGGALGLILGGGANLLRRISRRSRV